MLLSALSSIGASCFFPEMKLEGTLRLFVWWHFWRGESEDDIADVEAVVLDAREAGERG